MARWTSALHCSLYIVFHIIINIQCYTEDDIKNNCLPCEFGDIVIHPTDCKQYFYCHADQTWGILSCPASTYYHDIRKECIDPRFQHGPDKNCAYERGLNQNVNLPYEQLKQCANRVTSPPTTTTDSEEEHGEQRETTKKGGVNITEKPTETGSGDKNFTTKLLASLLAVAILILIAVVAGIFLYRWRQRKRRPENFYRKALGSVKDTTGLKPQPLQGQPTSNAAYLSRSLLNQQRALPPINGDEGSDPGYQEIPEYGKTYYSDPAVISQPSHLPVILTNPSEEDNVYAEATLPLYTKDYSADKSGPYQHTVANSTADAHMYTFPQQAQLQPTSPESDEYCDPVSAHPTLNNQPNLARPTSPPYYIDPIPGDEQPHSYHTLEPPKKR